MGTSAKLVEMISSLDAGRVNIMEVCGTHTMAIAKAGIKRILPEGVRLISGPGCPVCVTPQVQIDAFLELAMDPGVTICTYGDMLRVPGSSRGDSLARRRALGADVRIVYSPADAVDIAEREPAREVVFLGVGFETTAPGTAATVGLASSRGIRNYSVFTMFRLVEPALRALIADPKFNVQGFLCPGHVATVIGAKGFEFLPKEYGLPAVVCGFEPEDILMSVYLLLKQISEGRAELDNEYRRAVSFEGNPLALKVMEQYLEPSDEVWRGLGTIRRSGLRLKPEFAEFDAAKRFGIAPGEEKEIPGCRCGDIICGKAAPADCPLFGKACTPEDPVGPCMVSSEGACAAAYKYQEV